MPTERKIGTAESTDEKSEDEQDALADAPDGYFLRHSISGWQPAAASVG